jgi:hypothetical protein
LIRGCAAGFSKGFVIKVIPHLQSWGKLTVDIHLAGLPGSPDAGFPSANHLSKIPDFDTLSSSA